jgi:putative transcriptional regulator
MTAHVDDLLPEYALGTLGASERGAVEGHLRGCARCTAELAATSDALHAAALAQAELMAPQPKVKARLLERVRGKGRFAPFASRIAEMFDLAVEKIDALFETFEDAKNWVPGPGGGNELYFVPKGPRLAGAEAGFVRLDPGLAFPHHRHVGEETSLILSGELHEKESNQAFRPGDRVVRAAGSEHSFVVGPAGCLFAVVVFGGVEFPDLGVTYGGGSES